MPSSGYQCSLIREQLALSDVQPPARYLVLQILTVLLLQVLGHAAGALGKDAIPAVTAERFRDVCQPKIAISSLLDIAAPLSLPLKELALFSSTAAAWSQPEACHYSAANSALDALCSSCR